MSLKALRVAFCSCFRCASSSKGDNYNEDLSALALKLMPPSMKHFSSPTNTPWICLTKKKKRISLES